MKVKSINKHSETLRRQKSPRECNRFFLVYQITSLLTPLYLFHSKFIKSIGTCAIYLCIVFLLIETSYRIFRITLNGVIKAYFLVSACMIASFIVNYERSSFETILIQMSLLFFVAIFSTRALDEITFRILVVAGKITWVVLALFVSIVKCLNHYSSSEIFSSLASPVILKCLFISSFYFLFDTKNVYGSLSFLVFVFFVLGERGASLSLIVFLVSRLLLLRINKQRKAKRLHLLKVIFFVYIALILVIPITYVQLWKSPIARDLHEFTRRLTGHHFFSGRQIIWDSALVSIAARPVVGYGFGSRMLSSFGIEASTHNLFLNILLEGGIIYLLAFIVFLYSIWISIVDTRMSERIIVCATFLLSVLFTVSFENFLLGNMVSPSLMAWMLVGLGLSLSKNAKEKGQVSF